MTSTEDFQIKAMYGINEAIIGTQGLLNAIGRVRAKLDDMAENGDYETQRVVDEILEALEDEK